MKRIKNIVLLLASIGLCLTACQQQITDTEQNTPFDPVIRLSPGVKGLQSGFTTDNLTQFGFIVNNSSNGNYTYNNTKVTKSGTDWKTATKMLWQNDKQKVDLVAYAPYQTQRTYTINTIDATANVVADQSTPAKQDPCDFIVFKQVGYVPKTQRVDDKTKITFKHVMAKIVLTIGYPASLVSSKTHSPCDFRIGGSLLNGIKRVKPVAVHSGKTALKSPVNATAGVTNLTVGDFKLKGECNFVKSPPDVTVKWGSNDPLPITPHKVSSKTDEVGNTFETYELYVVPQTLAAKKLTIDFTIGNSAFHWESDKDITFEGGTASSLTIDTGLMIGDYFYQDGSYLSDYYNDPKNPCIGIVYWLGDPTAGDPTLAKDYPDCVHGLVVALKDLGSSIAWQNTYTDVNAWVTQGGSYRSIAVKNNTEGSALTNGYNNTMAIKAYNDALTDKKCYVLQNQTCPASNVKDASPWYLPSILELAYLCEQQSEVPVPFIGKGIKHGEVCSLINSRLAQIPSGAQQITVAPSKGYYWSSSEYTDPKNSFAWVLSFSSDNGSGGPYDTAQSMKWRKRGLRCVMAF